MNRAVERRPLATRPALVRVIFGLIWAADAWLDWQLRGGRRNPFRGFPPRSDVIPGLTREAS